MHLDVKKFDSLLASGALDGNPYHGIFRAVRRGECTLVSVFQAEDGKQPPPFEAPPTTRGVVTQIGDDPGSSRGVSAFDKPSIEKALANCDLAVLQVANFQPDVMLLIEGSARIGKRVVIVETCEAHEIEWMEYITSVRPPGPKTPMIVVTTRVNPQ